MQSFGGSLLKGFLGDLFMLEHPRWSAASIKLHRGFFEVALRRGCSPVDLVVFFEACFYDSISGGPLLHTEYLLYNICIYIFSLNTFNTLYVHPKALAFYLFQYIFRA